MSETYPMKDDGKLMHKTPYTFDVSVYEIFGWILSGSSLVILPSGQEKHIEDFIASVEKHNITHLTMVPALFGAFLLYLESIDSFTLSSLNYILLAGEALPPHLVKKYKKLKLGATLVNIYGPTESTVYSSQYTIDLNNDYVDTVPIGKPLPNVRMYILDTMKSMIPIGVVGELYISGDQLAEGYWNRPELTKERFIDNPYEEGNKLYKTGDLARWLPDGTIEYIGRIDDQVKIRGYRIELGEIETQLQSLDVISQSVVLARENKSGTKHLIAYVLQEEGFSKDLVITKLKEKLPFYMVPQIFVELDAFPLTSSGKIDRKSLPSPDIERLTTRKFIAPSDEVEEQLVLIWQELLGIEKVSVNDNFFELGGDSIRAMMLSTLIKKRLDVLIEIKTLFAHPILTDFAKYIKLQMNNKIKESKDYITIKI